MACMKCGKDTVEGRVFCEDCSEEMKKYPVSPNTPVILPKQKSRPGIKKPPKKKAPSAEEQLLVMKGRLRLSLILLAAVSILAALLMYPAVQYLQEDHFLPGQNYTSVVSKTTETTAPAD